MYVILILTVQYLVYLYATQRSTFVTNLPKYSSSRVLSDALGFRQHRIRAFVSRASRAMHGMDLVYGTRADVMLLCVWGLKDCYREITPTGGFTTCLFPSFKYPSPAVPFLKSV